MGLSLPYKPLEIVHDLCTHCRTGSYLPDNIVTNRDLEQKVETSDQWIRERTGIEQRHIALPGQSTVDLAEQAALNALRPRH